MALFSKSDKKMELPISLNSRYRPKGKRRFSFKMSYRLKNMLISIFIIASTIYFIRYMQDTGDSSLIDGTIDGLIEDYEIKELEDPEYYNYEFQMIDTEVIEGSDEGFEHYIINKEGTTTTKNDADYEEQLEMLLSTTVKKYDLSKYEGTTSSAENREHVLVCIPLRNAEDVLPLMFKHLMNLTYPHELIDLAFLVSDCSKEDKTLEALVGYAKELQKGTLPFVFEEQDRKKGTKRGNKMTSGEQVHLKYMEKDYLDMVEKAFKPPFHKDYSKPFRSVQIFNKDFGQSIGQGFSDRHHVKVQGSRRKLMARARNWLTSTALKPYHSWVYWRDVDIELCPGTIIEDLTSLGYDVMVPNVWRPLPVFLGSAQEYDLNSWIESPTALQLAKTLDEDEVIVEGYAEYATWRFHLANARDPKGDPRSILDLDGIGGVSIIAKAKLFRSGVHFAAFAFENHAETEAFGKMAKKMGYKVGGLPHYLLWHIYEPSDDDLRHMASMERQQRRL
ncbi:HDL460Wp [Eremothecium sinecaudum]|uniref:HDL460Wp n=1 Tax=Eremothecium sinecaudum TaxID=45286 RepID=A0A0X8HRS9_9SACH|nr:HDL460Wp [Eremothecium sinecaudum]AMD20284.1 HDL460Wp [Eremothecium sinecaudum]